MKPKRLTSRAVDHGELPAAVAELLLASKRPWLECETEALIKALDHSDICIEIWIREKA